MKKEQTIRFTIDLDKEMHGTLKVLSAGYTISMRDVVIKAISTELKKMQRETNEKITT